MSTLKKTASTVIVNQAKQCAPSKCAYPNADALFATIRETGTYPIVGPPTLRSRWSTR